MLNSHSNFIQTPFFLYEDNYSTTRGTVSFTSFTQPLLQKTLLQESRNLSIHPSQQQTLKPINFLSPGRVEPV